MDNSPISRKDNLVVQEMDGEVLIYDLSENKAFCLNETSALIWQLCDGDKSVAQISDEVSAKLGTPAKEDLVWLAIDQLKKEKLIANSAELPNRFGGMSRREVIRKVGLGTTIVLPIVAALVAPASVMAQSCLAMGGTFMLTTPGCTGAAGACTAAAANCCDMTATSSCPGASGMNTCTC